MKAADLTASKYFHCYLFLLGGPLHAVPVTGGITAQRTSSLDAGSQAVSPACGHEEDTY